MKDRIVKVELVRVHLVGHWWRDTVMQEIKQELSESAIRQMSFTHYLKLSEGDSIYLKAVSGEAYIGGKSKFMFSGEYISE